VHISCTQNKTDHIKYKHRMLQLLDRQFCYRFIRSSLNQLTSIMLFKQVNCVALCNLER